MTTDLPHLAASLALVVWLIFGGTIVWALLRSRLLHGRGWGASIGSAVCWAILYAILTVTVSDLGAGLMRSHPNVAIIIPFTVFLLPYLGIAHVLIKYRRAQPAAGASAPPSLTP